LFPEAENGERDRIAPGWRLETSHLPARDQLPFLVQELAAFAREVLPLPGRLPEDGFYSDCRGYFLPGLPLMTVKSDGYSFLPPEKKDPTLTDSYPWILMVRLQGKAEYVVDGKRFRYGPGSVNVRTPDNQQGGTLTESEQVMVYLEADQVSGLEDTLNWLGSAEGATSVHPLLGHYLAALGGVLPGISNQDAPTVASTTIAMIRACVSRHPDEIAAASHPMRATRLDMARKHVDAHLKAPELSSDHIRSVLGLSKRRMQDLFEGYGGVQNYIRTRRLNGCYQAILSDQEDRPIMKIAEDYGFSNSAHFSRAFKAQFGWSPSEARDMAKHNLNASGYESWLRDRGTLHPTDPGRGEA
ncbi:helix-turn-helix domain-containing protein, partial [uncultured Roseibium sp.]|uniref:helix-turn-helix domain-containing protein n=1 Tax=uncultured Roseibium sp. TaxID=1936171 RepID=UPI00321762A8